jgi:hypothetical protein
MNRQEVERIEDLLLGQGATLREIVSVGRETLTHQIGEMRDWACQIDEAWPDVPTDDEIAGAIIAHAAEQTRAAQILGRRGRAVNSPAQQAAARENGKRGGRPRLPRTK